MPSPPPLPELCALGARRVVEPLFGTASRVDLWLVLEVPGAWAEEIEGTIQANEAIRTALEPFLKAVPRSRILFIKGASRAARETFAFYVAITDEMASRLYHFELAGYEALAEIDLFAVLAEDPCYESHRDSRPLFLVCTHGTHDRCCAKFGFPTFLALAQSEPGRVWQSSHVGGDRFAANVVCLPHGIYYGQVEPEDREAMWSSADDGRLFLQRLRGRACYPAPVQVAEYHLRRITGDSRIPAYRLLRHQRLGGVTTASFLDQDAGTLHQVRVEPAPWEGVRPMTCGKPEAKPVTSYRLLDHGILPFAADTRSEGAVDYQLQPAAMRDYGFIFRLRRETLQRYLDEIRMAPSEQGPFYARFDVTRHQLVTFEHALAGAVSVLERETELHLANLHLLPAYQSRGLGTAILRGIQQQAASSRRRVTTQVLKVSPARAFYERLGFHLEDEEGLRFRMVWEP